MFSSKQPVDENDSQPNYNIFIANADGTDIDTVTTDHIHDNIHPTFLSGGAEVAFTSYYPAYDEDPFATFSNIGFKIYRNTAAGAPAFRSASMGAFSFGDWEENAQYNGIHEPQQLAIALQQVVEVPPNACIGTIPVGVNIRSMPNTTTSQVLGSIPANSQVWIQGQYPEGTAEWYYGVVIYGGLTGYFIADTSPNIQLQGDCQNIWKTNDPNGVTPTPTPTFTPSPTWDPAIPTLTPTMTPTPVPRVVAAPAQAFHDQHTAFGIPIPFNLWPVVEQDRFNNGYGPNGYAAYYLGSICQTPPAPTPTPAPSATPGPSPTRVPDACQYRNTNSIHTGVDFYTIPQESDVIALCDGVIIPGKIAWNGSGGGGSVGVNAKAGLSLRCFANDPFDTDSNGLRNLSNIVVVYNHLVLISGRVYPANPGGPYQIVKAGETLAHTTSYVTSAGDAIGSHLHLEMFIANGYQTSQAVQINPRWMFTEPIARPYQENPTYPLYPEPYNQWWLQGIIGGSNLFFWLNPNTDPPFTQDISQDLAAYYSPGSAYIGPNCDLPADETNYGIDSDIHGVKECSVSSNDVTFAPTPSP